MDVLYDIDKCASAGNKMLIKHCTFINNAAFQGASAYLAHTSKHGQPFLDTTVCCSTFTGGHCMISLINPLMANDAFKRHKRFHLLEKSTILSGKGPNV